MSECARSRGHTALRVAARTPPLPPQRLGKGRHGGQGTAFPGCPWHGGVTVPRWPQPRRVSMTAKLVRGQWHNSEALFNVFQSSSKLMLTSLLNECHEETIPRSPQKNLTANARMRKGQLSNHAPEGLRGLMSPPGGVLPAQPHPGSYRFQEKVPTRAPARDISDPTREITADTGDTGL